MVPEQLGITLDEALEAERRAEEGVRQRRRDPRADRPRHASSKGLARNVGTHAAAVVIADRPLIEYVPLQPRARARTKSSRSGRWATSKRSACLKMDFLGLRNLTMLAKAVELIEQTTGERVDPYKFPLDDAETFALLCRGETKGIFQLESGGIRDLLQQMKPDHFRDIIATNALYRPGPLEGGMVDDYVAGQARPQAGRVPAPGDEGDPGRDPRRDGLPRTGDADPQPPRRHRAVRAPTPASRRSARRSCRSIAKYREEFVAGADGAGPRARRRPSELFELIEKFAGYGFNKIHCTAYALIAYMTAYLKAHYPVEFMAALLSGDIEGRNFKKKDSLVEHLEDCRRMDIEVVPPDVNRSEADFTVADGKIHVRPGRDQGLRRRGGRGDRRGARDGRPVPQPVRFLRTARSSGRQPRRDRKPDQSRRL